MIGSLDINYKYIQKLQIFFIIKIFQQQYYCKLHIINYVTL